MVTLYHTAENTQADGTAATTGNSGVGGSAFGLVTVTNSAAVSYSTSNPYRGSRCLRVLTTATAGQAFAVWTYSNGQVTATATAYVRAYVRLEAIPGQTSLVRFRCSSGTTQVARVTANSSRQLELRRGDNTAVATSTTVLTYGQWYRIGLRCTQGATGSATLYIYTDPTSTTPAETLDVPSGSFGTANIDDISWGCVAPVASADYALDDIAYSDTGLPGPSTQSATVADSATAGDAVTLGPVGAARSAADSVTAADSAAQVTSPPTLIAFVTSTTNTSTSPKTVSVTVKAGDVLVVYGLTETAVDTLSTPTGGSLTYTPIITSLVAGRPNVYVWKATAAADATITVSLARASGTAFYALAVSQWRGSSGVGQVVTANSDTGLPSVSITPDGANSAVVVVNDDWLAVSGTTRAWLTSAGTIVEDLYSYVVNHYTLYGAHHGNVGAAGVAKTVGMSSPSTQTWVLTAVEIKGKTLSAGATSTSRSTADTATAADSAARVAATSRAIADAATAGDALTRSSARTRSAADTVTAADSAARVAATSRAATDAATVGDSATRAATACSRTAADAATVADTASRVGQASTRAAADTAAAADTVAGTPAVGRSIADAVAAGDVLSRITTASRGSADTVAPFGFFDAITATLARVASIADHATVVDALTHTAGGSRFCLDYAGDVSDYPFRSLAAVRAAADVVHVDDANTPGGAVSRSTADAVTAGDAPAARRTFARLAGDAVTVDVVAGVRVAAVRGTLEAVLAAATAARVLALTRAAAQLLTVVDGVDVGGALSRNTLDTVTAGDATSRQHRAARLVADLTHAADILTVVLPPAVLIRATGDSVHVDVVAAAVLHSTTVPRSPGRLHPSSSGSGMHATSSTPAMHATST